MKESGDFVKSNMDFCGYHKEDKKRTLEDGSQLLKLCLSTRHVELESVQNLHPLLRGRLRLVESGLLG